MSHAIGTLVKARGREWVVLPHDEDDILMLRPLGGTDTDACGIYLPLEGSRIESATFPPPDPQQVGDSTSGRLLQDAVRLQFRAGAGPFRCLGRLGVEPRPYQLVPLLMALKLSPVRMLIADDVGIGKTIEACLIARELLDRGEITRLAVICPPHLCEQWQAELLTKFNIPAEVVRPGTVARLERGLSPDQSVFDAYPFVIVSVDYIKSERRRDDFVRACPEFVIVDEAHTCASGASISASQHQRHLLLKELAKDPARSMVLVTATPHSGVTESFRSLLGLLDRSLGDLPPDLTGEHNRSARRQMARHFVQRRRADVRDYLDGITDFPDRLSAEVTYKLTPEYRRIFDDVLKYAREMIRATESQTKFRQRVSWWAALALLRCVTSSPAAGVLALTTRAARSLEEGSVAEVDAAGERTVLDADVMEIGEADDTVPAGDALLDDGPGTSERRRLREMARALEALSGDGDAKLAAAVKQIGDLVKEGLRPIVFCRFIATADYVAEELRKRLRGVTVESVTGQLPPEERTARVEALGEADKRVLVATDCLSEGINLQQHFDAVFHYDLSWNPTRHEQREGRVDRYGQTTKQARTVQFYGQDNRIDGTILKVLLRKAESIRRDLGVSVPVPASTNEVLEAIFEALFLKGGDESQLLLDLEMAEERLGLQWNSMADLEKRSRTLFAQESLKPEEVKRELEESWAALGHYQDVERFVIDAAQRLGAPLGREDGAYILRVDELPAPVRERCDIKGTVRIAFTWPVVGKTIHIARTHPLIEALGSYLVDTALEAKLDSVAARCGAIRTDAVTTRTNLLVLRLRYHLETTKGGQTTPLLVEECIVKGFERRPDEAQWLPDAAAQALLNDAPLRANTPAGQQTLWVRDVVGGLPALEDAIAGIAQERAEAVLESHQRVREAAKWTGISYKVQPILPADILGAYVLMPA